MTDRVECVILIFFSFVVVVVVAAAVVAVRFVLLLTHTRQTRSSERTWFYFQAMPLINEQRKGLHRQDR